MKKIIFVLLICLNVLLSGCTSNEETTTHTPNSQNNENSVVSVENFPLHSGVHFGMSMEEVKKVETAAGYNIKEDNLPFFEDTTYYLYLSAPNLAGVGGNVYYFESESHEVNMCLYSFHEFNDETVNSLVEAYTDKYGTVVGKGQNYVDIPGSAHDAYDRLVEMRARDYTVSLNNLYQWIYPLEDGSAVDIMMIEWIQRRNKIGYNPAGPIQQFLFVTYSYRSADEMELHYDKIEKMEDARNSDI